MFSRTAFLATSALLVAAVQASVGPLETTAASPIVHHKPFVVVWNMPTSRCQSKFGISFDLAMFDIVENQQESFQGQNMTIFYRDSLGQYPYITPEGELTNGGVPQEAALERHLGTAKLEIEDLLREDFSGLAVIDWEEWRPLWARNWGSLRKYRRVSKKLVRLRHPELPEKKVLETAKMEFEMAARELMSRTLQLGSHLRPLGMWGYYKFPDCYNYNWKKPGNYTGHCHPKDPERNDRLAWMWQGSTALYPSIYLHRPLASSGKGALYVRYRVLEAMRVATSFASASGSLPVLPYARVAFAQSLKYLSQMDLEHTIGESASLGAAGVVLWGDLSFTHTQHTCEELQEYVSGVLGRYVVNVTTAARQCSARLCSGNGRCARRDQNSNTRFHLSPYSFQIISPPSPGRGALSVRGKLSKRDLWQLQDSFRCVCYRGWSGLRCQDRIL
ncbi:hyaluronidase-1-like [Polyodon spathula]|uniref:hyaluronidase-1-like n=1 Tax=Polyodon spathula TaxID=7913 RepID=UPI001B7E6E7E|nr:hyaluronidase-1-like [Polyodon spathula]